MGAAKLWNRGAYFGLFKYADDLAVGKTRFLQGNLLGLAYEKIPLLAALIYGGITVVNPSTDPMRMPLFLAGGSDVPLRVLFEKKRLN